MTTRGWTLKTDPDGKVEVDRLILDGPYIFRRDAERAARIANGLHTQCVPDGFSADDELEEWAL